MRNCSRQAATFTHFKRTPVGIALVMLMGSAGHSTPAPLGQAGPRIFDVTPAHGVADGQPVQPGDVFTPDDNPIYVWFRQADCPAGATMTSDWFYLGAQPPLHISQGRATVGAAADSGQFNLELGPGKRWPLGNYRVELRVNGALAAEGRFRVAEREMPPAARAVYTHPRAGYEFTPPTGWALHDSASPADVQMKPTDGDGLIEVASGAVSARLDPVSYAAGWESRAVGPGQLLLAKRAGRAFSLNGEMAYEGVYEGRGVLAKVVFVGLGSRFYVLTGVFPLDSFERGEPIVDQVALSLRGPR